MTARYDRTGDRIEVDDEEPQMPVHPQNCDRGWLPVEADVPAVAPCPVCRPALVARLRERKDFRA